MEFSILLGIYESACPGVSGFIIRFQLSAHAGWNWSRKNRQTWSFRNRTFPTKRWLKWTD